MLALKHLLLEAIQQRSLNEEILLIIGKNP